MCWRETIELLALPGQKNLLIINKPQRSTYTTSAIEKVPFLVNKVDTFLALNTIRKKIYYWLTILQDSFRL